MGIGTTKQRELAGMASWQSGIAGANTGIKNPLNALDSLAEYTYHVIDHTDRAVAEWNILSRMTGATDAGDFVPGRSKVAEFLGIHDPTGPDAGNFKKAILNNSPAVRKKFGSVDDADFLQHQGAALDEVIKVQRNGKEYLFWVPDPTIREIMQFKPRVLGNINKIGRNFKKVFQGTTTRLPFFTPISFGYTTQQAWQNAVASGAKFTPADAFRGAWRGMADGLADEVSQQWAHSMRTETGIISMLPRQFVENMTARMKKVVENSLLNGIQRQQGSFGSSVAGSEFNPDVLDLMKQIVPTYRDGFSGLSSAWRMYNIINRSVHEGAAAGAMLKALKGVDNPSASTLRTAGREAKTLVGDVRRMGSSDVAVTFGAWVPFSGAMIQSWNSIGHALRIGFRENPTRAIAAISIPVIPAIMEAVNNSLLGEEYSNYYWNVLSVEQRNNNIVLMFPWLPPEKAWMIPVSPENTLMRAMGIEMVDALTGASRQEHMPRSERGPTGMTQNNGAHIMAALVRIFDIPVPPAIQAMFALAGYNLRLGPQFHNNSVQMPFNIRDLNKGEQVSGNRGRSRYVDAAFDTEAEGAVRALLGAVGATVLGVTEAFRQGTSVDLETGVDFAMDAALQGVQSQTKYAGSLFQNTPFHPTSFDHIADSNRQKQSGIDGLNQQLKLLLTGGKVHSLDTPLPFSGSSLSPSDDPILKIVAPSIPEVIRNVELYKTYISSLRLDQQDLRSSATMDGKVTDVFARRKRIDEHELTIKSLQAKQNFMLQIFEDKLSETINERLGLVGDEEITFTFDDYIPRPNLGEGLISKAPRK
jgi:hypothetical protein